MVVKLMPLIAERCGETVNLGEHLLDHTIGTIQVILSGLFGDFGQRVGRQPLK
jgi:hypothetical protein